MRVRLLCLLLPAAVGCETLRHTPPATPPADVAARSAPVVPAVTQAPADLPSASAVRPATPAAPMSVVQQDVSSDVRAFGPSDPLELVAECLARDDASGAALHLDAYVRTHPDRPLFRFQLADLYQRSGQLAQAKFHYERFVADADAGPAALRPHVVTAHVKLLEIAQQRNDRFGELLHRGVGLLLIVKQLDADPARDPAACEEMLCKALVALGEAKDLKPRDPRARAALAEAHERAGNRRAAAAERAGVRADAVSGGPAEVE
jgi:tetratricopeptide (TPR) repeat protein